MDKLFYSVDSTIILSCTQGKHDLLSHIHNKLTPLTSPNYFQTNRSIMKALEHLYSTSLCIGLYTIFFLYAISWSGHARYLFYLLNVYLNETTNNSLANQCKVWIVNLKSGMAETIFRKNLRQRRSEIVVLYVSKTI